MSGRRCLTCGKEAPEAETHVCDLEPGSRRGRGGEPPPRGQPDAPSEGQVLAERFVLLEKVGEGGSGTVFRAHDQELGVDVAVKVLPPGDASSAVLGRFKREIRITRDLDHPNVARVFDLGESDGLTFLTMRLIDGEPLHRRVLREGPLRGRALARVTTGLVAALAAAHRLGIVHRDIKPSNVLVSSDGDPVLIDFGIATDAGSSGPAKTRRGDPITLDGLVPGTPAFMAPEQERGEETTPQSDLYALALTLVFAATGESRLSPRPERAFAPFRLPMQRLLVRCLEPDPSRRPSDALELQETLARPSRSSWAFWIGAVAIAALLLGVAVIAFTATRTERAKEPPRPPRVSVQALDNRTGDPTLDWLEHGVEQLLVAGFEASARVRLVADPAATDVARVEGRVVGRGDEVALELLLRAPEGEVLARNRVERATGDALFRQIDDTVETFLAALGSTEPAAARRGSGSESLTDDPIAFAHYARAQDLLRKHRNGEALVELRRATTRDPALALAHLQRFVLVATGNLGPRAEAEAALGLAEEHRERLPPSQRELLEALGEARAGGRESGRFNRLRAYLRSQPPDATSYWMASQLVKRNAELRRDLLLEWASRLPEDPEPHNQLGYLLFVKFADAEAAEREFREYLRLAPEEANAHDSYADFLREQGRLDEALRAYDRALELDPTFTSAAVDSIGAAIRGDDLRDAEERISRARRLAGPDSRDFDPWVRAYASVPILAGDRSAALGRLAALARDRTLGSRRYVARKYEAIVRGLEGDGARARRTAEEADRLHRLYHGSEVGLPTLSPYVEGLAAHRRGDRRALSRALERYPPARPDEDAVDSARRILLEGLERRLSGDPTAAAERLVVPPIGSADGVPFLAALARARALVAAGRLAEGERAYEEAMDRRQRLSSTPEGAHEWRACLREASALFRDRGNGARAAALDERLAALVLTPPGL